MACTAPWSVADVESFITDYYRAWAGRDEDLILSCNGDDVVLQIPGTLKGEGSTSRSVRSAIYHCLPGKPPPCEET